MFLGSVAKENEIDNNFPRAPAYFSECKARRGVTKCIEHKD